MNDLDIARKMCSKADNAKQRGLEYSLSFADVKRLMLRKTCFYSKRKFTDVGGDKRTFDRIDSKLGYTKANTVACTSSMNKLKNRLLEELDVNLVVVKRMIKSIEDLGELK